MKKWSTAVWLLGTALLIWGVLDLFDFLTLTQSIYLQYTGTAAQEMIQQLGQSQLAASCIKIFSGVALIIGTVLAVRKRRQ